jgi:Na+/H+-dicarboxylate symporter
VIATLIGLIAALSAHLGQGVDPAARDALANQASAPALGAAQAAAAAPTLIQTLISMIPQNPFAAAAQADLLPLIVAVCLFGAAATVVTEERRRPLVAFFESVNALSMVVIRWLMSLAPVAVFVLIAGTVATSGVDLLESLLRYVLVAIGAMCVHMATTLLIALRAGAGEPAVPFVRAISDALLLAFSTASSSVALPVSMRAARERLGLRQDVVSFVLPAGVTLNKNGAAVYKAVTAVFIANVYGLALGPAQLVAIVVTTVMASSAGAGVPGSSLVTTLIVLNAIGLGPHAAAGIALVVAVDRPLDMVRTTVNTLSNLVGAAWISRSEDRAAASAFDPAAVGG